MPTSAARLLCLLALCTSPLTWAETACAPFIEEQPAWETAALRPHTDAFMECPVSEERYQQVIKQWLDTRTKAQAAPRSLGLGRAIDLPWISRYLAQAALASPAWDTRRGHGKQGNDNAVVGALLSAPEFLARLQAPFDGSGYRVKAVPVEKVLVGPAETYFAPDTPTDTSPTVGKGQRSRLRVPFDAQLWLILQREDPAKTP